MRDPLDRHDRQLAVVTEAFLDRSLIGLLDWLAEAAPEVTAVEVGSGGYAPHPHCDRQRLLAEDAARARWLHEIETRGFQVAALNAWGNPLHPDHELAARHDRDLRDTIRLAAALGVERVVALAGCPPAVAGDRTPYFAGGGWLPYLEDVYEAQWESAVAPYWNAVSAFAQAEHPRLQICLELHPGTAVYNVETYRRLAAIGPNLAANIDPSHFFWQQMSTEAVIAAIGDRVGHVHAKDVVFNPGVLATEGLLDHRWPGPTSKVAWKFATVGDGHDGAWWQRFAALTAAAAPTAPTIAIEHEDPDVPPQIGVPLAARLLAGALEVAA